MSTYSLQSAIASGEMTLLESIEWIADQGGEHVEIVPINYTLTEDERLVEAIVKKTKEVGIDISNYAIDGAFLQPTEEAFEREMTRVKAEVDIAHQLGVTRMRHDVSFKPATEGTVKQFEIDLPQLVEGCRQIADYAKQYGITTSIENHGYYVQGSERIQRIVNHVNRDNFKTTLDIGNFLCFDENPTVATKRNIPFASMVHVKDFYYREASGFHPGEGWFESAGGNYLRAAISGHGDINMKDVLTVIKKSGYDDYISIEFEGMEECKKATRIGMENVKRIWDSI